MMQTLLEERFKLKIHKESKEFPVYELTVAKGGLKLQVAQEGSCILADADHPPNAASPRLCGGILGGKSGLDGYAASMNRLSEVLSELLDRDVIDKTGITGMYDFHFDIDMEFMRSEVSREAATATPRLSENDVWPIMMLSAFRSQLPKAGLSLEPARATGEFLVIDHIERPADN